MSQLDHIFHYFRLEQLTLYVSRVPANSCIEVVNKKKIRKRRRKKKQTMKLKKIMKKSPIAMISQFIK